MTIETFELVKERCLLAHVNVRTEMHGDDRTPAYDLKFEISLANSVLLKFHPDLRAAFYRPDENRDIDQDHMPHLKFPLIESLNYGIEIPRTRLEIHDPDDSSENIVLAGGKTNKFKFTMLDGGTVKMQFRCQFSEADEDDVAKLLRVLNQSVPVSISCEAAEEQPDNFEQAEKLGKEPMSKAREEAESLFSKAPPDGDIVDAIFHEPEHPSSNVEPIKKASRKRASAGGATVE